MAEIARGSRFSLLAIEGFTNNPSASTNGPTVGISYCIIDRAWNNMEVWRDYSGENGRNYGTRIGRRAKALAKLDELEVWEAECLRR